MNQALSQEPWRLCYRELAPKLVLFARQWVACAADAEDVVQTAFVKFWRQRPDAACEHYPLLFTAVRTTALDFLRGTARRTRREADPAVEAPREDEPFFDTTLEEQENAALIEAALRKLPAPQREVLVLHVWAELTFHEIAVSLGEPLNTVASRYRYALQTLRRNLHSHEPERLRT